MLVKMRTQELLQQCQELKDSVLSGDGGISWEIRLKLQQILERAILADVDYALSKQCEQTLWNCCFKSCIDVYQTKLKSKKNNDDVAVLSVFLTSSLGFFSQLLTKLCRFYRLSINECVKSDTYMGIVNGHWNNPREAKKSNLLYFVQFCLIHMGDVSRYQKRLNEAETFYTNACRVCPSNGHPFNQLAILETARNRHLSANYLYTRSLYVENPFSLASTNLDKFYSTVDWKATSASSLTYVEHFFKFIAAVHFVQLEDIELLTRNVCDELSVAFTNESIVSHDLLHIFVVTVGCIWKLNPSGDSNSLNAEALDEKTENCSFSVDEKRCLKLLINFMQHLFHALLRSFVDEEKDVISLIILAAHWFTVYPTLLTFNRFCETSQFIPTLVVFLNSLPQTSRILEENEKNNFADFVLNEEREFRGFLPLQQSLKFDSSMETCSDDVEISSKVRHKRLVAFGKRLADLIGDGDIYGYQQSSMIEEKFVCIEFKTKIIRNESPVKIAVDEKAVKFKSDELVKSTAVVDTTKQSKRQTKVLPLLTIFEKEKTGAEVKEGEQHQPKIKIAAPGSAVELPLASEKKEDDASNDDTQSLVASQSEKGRYELPPRFQAAKLKHALTGGGTKPADSRVANPFPNFFTTRPPPPPNFNLSTFAPLNPNQMPPPPAEFHKTPGVRPPGMSMFPFGSQRPMPMHPDFANYGNQIRPRNILDLTRPPPMGFQMGPSRNADVQSQHRMTGVWPPGQPMPPHFGIRQDDLPYSNWAPDPAMFLQNFSSTSGENWNSRQERSEHNSGRSSAVDSIDAGHRFNSEVCVAQYPITATSKEEENDEGQFSLFGSGNPLEYSKWSNGNNVS